MTVFIILLDLCVLLLIVGLIKPSWVIKWGNRTRKQVLTVYGLSTLVFLVLAVATSAAPTLHKPSDGVFTGKIVYESSIEGNDTLAEQVAKLTGSEKVNLVYNKDKFLYQKTHRFLDRTFVMDISKNEGFLADHNSEEWSSLRLINVDEPAKTETDSINVRYLTAQLAGAKLEKTSETKTICGYTTTMYNVENIDEKRGEYKIWLADDIEVPARRFLMQDSLGAYYENFTPLMLELPQPRAILRIQNKKPLSDFYEVYEATSVHPRSVDEEDFDLPENYSRKGHVNLLQEVN